MGHSSSKVVESVKQAEPSLSRAKTMLDVSQAQYTDIAAGGDMKRSNSDSTLNKSFSATQAPEQKSYQQALEWGRTEHFFKLAHTFHTNNY